ncbi:MAG TPA: DUF4255 domain-containing protein [Longimicrobium sp.]|jgi:hypothetical protein|nr:DUF4255 domain-containing protein [Longimicrobium sp.]
MAGFDCIAATGKSLERLLTQAFQPPDNPLDIAATVKAVLIRTEDFEHVGTTSSVLQPPMLSIFLYRVDFNKAMRAGWSGVGSLDGRSHLPLDLHFLLTAWAANAEYELRILGRAMQCLETYPSLSGPLLAGSTWAAGDSVQMVLEEISTEAVMRTFDSLPHDYKLSIPYVARVVRLDGLKAVPAPDVHTAVTGVTAAAA